MTEPDGWRRLHPLSPIVRGGRATIAIAVIILPTVFGARRSSNSAFELAAVAVIVGLGFVSWLVTRWRIDGDDLRIETGLIRRQSLRFPLSQVQAIDVVRPGLGRLLRVAELRLRMGGATGKTGRLAYLHEREVEPLRDRLLALARGTSHVEERDEPVREERVLATVPTGRLVASILISDVGIMAEAVLVGLVLGIVFAPSAAAGLASGGAVWVLSVFQLVWRRFNQEYRLTVVEVSDGLVLRGGLVALTAETIRPGRVQAVRMVEPIAWRRLGWCRLEVDLAGRQRAEGEGRAQRRSLRAVLPVGSRAVAEELLDHLLPDRPRELSRPPRRAVWKSPLRYRMLAWGRTPTCVATTSGRLRRATNWVPLEKAQSLRRVQGPFQRRLRLASVHVDTAGRNVHAVVRDRDVEEANGVLEELVASAEAARRAA
jgi:putative membrane protein